MKKLIIALFAVCIMLTASLAATVTITTSEGKVCMLVKEGSEVALVSTGANSGWLVIKGEADIIDNKFIMPNHDLEIIEVNDLEYTITYDLNGGTVSGSNPTTYRMTSNAMTLINPTKPGYGFLGWIGSGLKEETKTVIIPKGSAGNRKYEAIWGAEKYSINYITDSRLPSGYIGLSYIESSGTEYIDTGIIADQDTGISIVAEASSIADASYGIGFIPYGAGIDHDKSAFECYSHISTLEFNYENQYDFVGTPKVNKIITINHNKNVVTYSVDGNEYIKEFNYSNYTTPYTVTLFGLHRSTMVLSDSMKLYSCKMYDNGTLVRDFIPCINPNNEVGLYDTVNRIFYRNEGTGAFKPSETYVKEYAPESNNIVLPVPSRPGYVFNGWTGSNGTTASTSVTIPKGSRENKEYRANWTPITYSISYNLNGGSVATSNLTSYNVETSTFTLNNPIKNGYTFVGWTGTGLGSASKTVTIAKGSTGNRAYTATWTPTNYAIAYNLNGGTVSTSNPTSYTIETAAFTLNNPTRNGYTFVGWTGTGLGSASKTVTIAKGSTGDRNYTANWQVSEITYDYGYTLPNGYTQLEYIESTGTQVITTGVVGGGKWELDIQFTTTSTGGRQLMGYGGSGTEYWGILDNGTYGLADWWNTGVSAGNRDIIIHNYGEGSNYLRINNWQAGLSNTDVTTKEYKLLALDVVPDTFNCYAKLYRVKVTQNDVLVRDFIPCKNSSGVIGLYDKVTGRFFGNSGTGVFIAGPTVTATKTITMGYSAEKGYITLPTLTRSGYVFNGWNTAQNGSGTNYAGGTNITVTQNMTLYAQWVDDDYTIAYEKESKLPIGYTELEYIESTGTQYINTGFKPNGNTRILVRASQTGPYSIYGAGRGYSNFTGNDSGMYFYYDGYSSSGGQDASSITNLYNAVHMFDQNKNVCYVDGNLYHTFNLNSSYTAPSTLFLFGRNDDSGALNDAGGTVRIYYAKIYDNGTLIRDFVPAKNSSGVIGLYDAVENKFYTNAGTGTFVAGSEYILPAGYTKVGYLQATGTQYIDTGITYSDSNKYQTKLALEFNTTSLVDQIFGFNGHRGMGIGLSQYADWWECSGAIATTGKVYNLDWVKNGSYYSRTVEGITYSGNDGNNGSGWTGTMKLFAADLTAYDSTISYATNGKLYEAKIYVNDVLKRYFIPVMNSSGVLGLYDFVESKFYTNAGTGTFGSTVLPTGYTELEYIQSSGTQYIDTGVNWDTNNLRIQGKYSYNALMGHSSIFGTQGEVSNLILREESGTLTFWTAYNSTSQPTTVSVGDLIDFDLNMSEAGTYSYSIMKNDEWPITGSATHTNEKQNYSIYIFDTHYDITDGPASLVASTIACKAKLYAFKIWKNSTLVRDFVPAMNSSGVVGLYDRLNNIFYTNKGTGTLTAGNKYVTTYNISSPTITLPVPTKLGYTFRGWVGSNGTTPQTSVTIPSGSTGSKSYSAIWIK